MLTLEERRYLRWLTAECWQGVGHVLEIGPWLGGSTACLAQGLADRDYAGPWRIHTVDNFVWRAFMSERATAPLQEGDSFERVFLDNVAAWRERIVHWRRSLPDDDSPLDRLAAAIRDDTATSAPPFYWEPREPIEIVFIDGAKTWAGLIHLLRQIADHLVPDRTLWVCQDYQTWDSYWVPLLMEILAEQRDSRGKPLLELEHVLPANTVTFRAGELTSRDIDTLPASLARLGVDAALSLLDRAAERLKHGDRPGAHVLQVAKVRLLGNLDCWSDAEQAFRAAEKQWPIGSRTIDLERARHWLADHGHPVRRSAAFGGKQFLSSFLDFGRRVRRRTGGRG